MEQGEASWYGPGFHGKTTATGQQYDQEDLSAAHRKLPLGTSATVTNLENGKQVEVEINGSRALRSGARNRFVEGRRREAGYSGGRDRSGAH